MMANGNGGFNPLDIVENLQNAGVPEEQAKVHARALSQVADHAAATKQDLEVLKLELKREIADVKRDIENVKSELKRDIAELNSSLTTKMVIVVGVGISIMGTLMAVLRFWPLKA